MATDSTNDGSDRSLRSKLESTAANDRDPTGHPRLVQWFRRWRKPLRRWIAGKPSVPAAEADDLTQEVFLRILRYSDGVLIKDPQGYLFRVATNVVNEWRGRCRVRMEHDESWLEELQIDPDDEPGNKLALAWSSRHLWTAVNRLPPRQRELLLLHVTEGMTYKQIAQARGLTYRIVLRDLCRAYVTLRATLIPEEL